MNKERLTKVVLEVSDTTKSFSIEHAEKILRMSKNGGWKLPKNSPFKFDLKNGLSVIRNKNKDQGVEQKGDNKQSD